MTGLTERDLVMLTVWAESRGEPVEGKIAVACVLQNRLESGRWGTTYEQVVLAPKQFTCWNASDRNLPKIQAIIAQIIAGTFVPDPVMAECYWIADGLLANVIRPRVKNALHYYGKSMKKPPKWAATGDFVAEIGAHKFIANVT